MALNITPDRKHLVLDALDSLVSIAKDDLALYDEVIITALKLHHDLLVADYTEHYAPGTMQHTDATKKAETIKTMLKEVGEKPWY